MEFQFFFFRGIVRSEQFVSLFFFGDFGPIANFSNDRKNEAMGRITVGTVF